MKDMSTSSNQEMPRSSNQELVTITKPTISMERFESLVEENNEVPTRSKRQRIAKSFGDDFLVYHIDDNSRFYFRGLCI